MSDQVEGDWSQAGFWYAAVALGNQVEPEGLNAFSIQGDMVVVAHFLRLSKPGDVTIDVSNFIEEEDTLLEIKRDGETVYSKNVGTDTATITVGNQSGIGEVEYAIYVNGALVGSEKVDF